MAKAVLGIIGGSGIYDLPGLENVREEVVRSPWGEPSAPLWFGSIAGLPIVSALSRQGIPTIITGFSLPDANIHSPNERLLVEYVERGISAAMALFEEFAGL